MTGPRDLYYGAAKLMPLGIVNVLQKDQVLDLVAYLISDPAPKTPAKK